jgi:nitroreductase
MDFMNLIKERYSVRNYDSRPIEAEKLEQILEAGRLAPTAKNMQPQRFYVMETEAAKNKLAELTPCTFSAPVVILVCADTDSCWHSDKEAGYISAEMDASIACTHMMLAAQSLGIGSCWVRWFNAPEVAAAFELPANIRPICILDLGYAGSQAAPSPRHEDRLPLADITVRL